MPNGGGLGKTPLESHQNTTVGGKLDEGDEYVGRVLKSSPNPDKACLSVRGATAVVETPGPKMEIGCLMFWHWGARNMNILRRKRGPADPGACFQHVFRGVYERGVIPPTYRSCSAHNQMFSCVSSGDCTLFLAQRGTRVSLPKRRVVVPGSMCLCVVSLCETVFFSFLAPFNTTFDVSEGSVLEGGEKS